jgi:hypothetical protein
VINKIGPTTKQAFSIVAAALLGGVIVYFAVRAPEAPREPAPFQGQRVLVNRPTDESSPGESVEAVSMSDEIYTAMHSRVTEVIGMTDAPSQSAAADAITEYAAYIADGDVDRMLALGLPVGATPDAEMVSRFRSMLAAFPPRGQPSGWQTFNDLQVLRWGFASARRARWESVALDAIEAQYFPAGTASEASARLWVMNPPDGYRSSGEAQALFQIPGLNERARTGEVASLRISFPVQIERGDLWLVSVLLAEHKPGEWYPVFHRTDVAKSVDPFPSNRAPRPE